jgi:hypothetical protein
MRTSCFRSIDCVLASTPEIMRELPSAELDGVLNTVRSKSMELAIVVYFATYEFFPDLVCIRGCAGSRFTIS